MRNLRGEALGFLRSFVGGKIRVGNDETMLVVRHVVFVFIFDVVVGHLRSPEEEGLIQILRETLTVSYSRWIHKVGESIRTSDSNGGEKGWRNIERLMVVVL